MGLAELLVLVSREGSSVRAWERLYAELDSLLSSFADYRQLQKADREDILQTMAQKLLSLGVLPVAGKSEGECRMYLSRMFRHLVIERARKSVRELPVESLPDVEVRPAAEAMVGVRRMGELLERVFQALVEQRKPHYRPALQDDWAEVRGLMSGSCDMEKILLDRENVTPSASPAERAAAMQRIYKRHSRLRNSLVLMARQMQGVGQLSTEELEQVVKLSEWMDRSQQKGGKT